MNFAEDLRPAEVVAAVLLLAPMLVAAFAPRLVDKLGHKLPRIFRIASPALLCIPYAIATKSSGNFRWPWLVVYAVVPVAIAFVLDQARSEDLKCRGNWRDFAVLLALGLAVDLRWLEPAWPHGLSALGKMLLLDAGILGFLVVRRLDGVGFDLRLTRKDLGRGLFEYLLYALIAVPLGLWLGFLHFHGIWPSPLRAITAFVFTFLFIAIPEELFFRGYLLERLEQVWPPTRRLLGAPVGLALLVCSALFALGHVLVVPNPQRLAVFFPALIFGWMRARTGSLAAGAAFHALCNLLSDVLHTSFF